MGKMGMGINNGNGDGDKHSLLSLESKLNWRVLPGVIFNVIRGTLV